ncbi:hypothetical protein L596_005569 [Steinernema carpocapsae]|uniref:Uncharacterized protein n=1 Tax=Steinernema carpocapsae TaxID=34508 RepID=A0A4U8V4F2_STECR|nr:hypothetical protein L596_005569 [Steinernema carpocapsae]
MHARNQLSPVEGRWRNEHQLRLERRPIASSKVNLSIHHCHSTAMKYHSCVIHLPGPEHPLSLRSDKCPSYSFAPSKLRHILITQTMCQHDLRLFI